MAERTAGELSRADAGFSFRHGDGFPFRGRGIGVPTLADVLLKYRDVRIIVELKGDRVAWRARRWKPSAPPARSAGYVSALSAPA